MYIKLKIKCRELYCYIYILVIICRDFALSAMDIEIYTIERQKSEVIWVN